MKKLPLGLLLVALCCVSLAAQKISKPTLTPAQPSAAQKLLIREAVTLHDAKKYDEAIGKYEQVLLECKDCTMAMYEMALSYNMKGETTKALEIASIGAKYQADELPLFYILIANILDDRNEPKKAIEIYHDALKILKDEKNRQGALSSLYYNLGVTHFRQKQYKEAREALKNSVENNFRYPSPNYLLAEVFAGSNYKVPAMLAAARLVSLELNTQRASASVQLFLATLQTAKKDEKTGNIQIFLDLNAPKDEGDFATYDLLLGTLTAVKDDEDKNKTEEELFAGAFETMIGLLEGDKKLASTFVGKTYIPFLSQVKKRGYSQTFAYLILQQSGNLKAEKWLLDNGPKTAEFLDWAKRF